MGTFVVTGGASGIGAATAQRLRDGGHRVVTVDLHDADVVADLGTDDGRGAAVEAVAAAARGALDGVASCAGLGGRSDRAGSGVVSVNHFGTVAVLDGLRPLLARGGGGAAVAVSSNSATCQPGLPTALVDACLAGDEREARRLADADWAAAYAASKVAVARWVRRTAPTAGWIGAGVRLNAVAPGAVETPLLAETRSDPVLGPLLDGFPIPVGAPARPDDIAGAIAFLLGPDAAFVCGSVVYVDGGTDALLRADDWPAPWLPAT